MTYPDILAKGFKIDEPKLRALDIPVEEMLIEELSANLDIPYWEQENTDDRNLTPRMCIENFEKEVSHAAKIQKADISYPIEIYFNKGTWIILDGVHRFTKLVMSGAKTIKVRKISRNDAQKALSEG